MKKDSLYYKEDWAEVPERYKEFWRGD